MVRDQPQDPTHFRLVAADRLSELQLNQVDYRHPSWTPEHERGRLRPLEIYCSPLASVICGVLAPAKSCLPAASVCFQYRVPPSNLEHGLAPEHFFMQARQAHFEGKPIDLSATEIVMIAGDAASRAIFQRMFRQEVNDRDLGPHPGISGRGG
jgi:hypothetical protein